MATPNDIQGLPDGAVLKPIGSAQTAVDPSQIQGLPAGAVLKPIAGIDDTTSSSPAPGTTGVSGFLNKVGEGGAEAARDIYSAVKPLAERAATSMIPGMPLVQAAQDLPGVAKTIWDNLPPVQLADSVKQILPLVDAYEKARAKGAPISDAINAVNDAAKQHTSNIIQIAPVVEAFKANPTRETARALTDAAALAASMFVGGGPEAAAAVPEEAAAVAPAAAPAAESEGLLTRLTNPFKAKLKAQMATPEAVGEAASQPIAQAGVKSAAPTVGASLRSGIDVEKPLAAAKKLYQVVDDAAKTDFKVLYDKLDAAQDAARIAAPGSPEEAVAQRNIKAVEDSITEHKAIAEKSGVPNVDKTLAQADAKFAETQANKDFNSKFFGNQGVISGNIAHGAPETINVDNAIKTLENFDKPNKFGVSRLQMTSLGKDGAFKLKQVLYDAQKAGQTAMDARTLRNTILKWGIPGVGSALGVGYELTK